jgi:hypothetical protein
MGDLLVMKRMSDPFWMRTLPKNSFIWLVKEGCFAILERPYQEQHALERIGTIILRRLLGLTTGPSLGFSRGNSETWHVRENGQGLDGSQIIMPVLEIGQGHSPKEIELLLSQIQQELAHISQRVSALEQILSPPTPVLVKHTNGYCDTCGDMYVKGYERCHPKCQREEA